MSDYYSNNVTEAEILIVDDTPVNLRLLSKLLGKQGYAVRPANSGSQALTAARLEPPDLILLDIMMPGMDGYAVCEQLKADSRTAAVPIIFISALSETDNKVKGFSLGGVDYITKPFQAEEVLARVATHLSLQQMRRQLNEQNEQLHCANEALRESQQRLEESYRREQTRRQLSDTLREVARIVSGTLEQQEVLDLILSQLDKVITYHRAAVMLLEDSETRPPEPLLTTVAGRDKATGRIARETIAAYQYPIAAAVLTEKQPLLLPDVTDDERWHSLGTMRGIRSFISAPLLVQEQPIGLLTVGRRDETPYTNDDTKIVFAFANQVAVALERARLHEYKLRQTEREMEIARQIQVSLLPTTASPIPGLDIVGLSQPAQQVGGDFYNYFPFAEGCLGIAVGDVSGKGIHAALMMALALGVLNTEIRWEIAPAPLLALLNEELRPHTARNGLNTALGYVIMEQLEDTWVLHVANAGLISPLVRRADGAVEWIDVIGLPLGVMPNATYRETRQLLHAGDVVILQSDGIVETMNARREIYGFERLVQRVAAAPRGEARAIQQWILQDVRDFAGDTEMHDDWTLIVVAIE